jgi:hypothetical protein
MEAEERTRMEQTRREIELPQSQVYRRYAGDHRPAYDRYRNY